MSPWNRRHFQHHVQTDWMAEQTRKQGEKGQVQGLAWVEGMERPEHLMTAAH